MFIEKSNGSKLFIVFFIYENVAEDSYEKIEFCKVV